MHSLFLSTTTTTTMAADRPRRKIESSEISSIGSLPTGTVLGRAPSERLSEGAPLAPSPEQPTETMVRAPSARLDDLSTPALLPETITGTSLLGAPSAQPVDAAPLTPLPEIPYASWRVESTQAAVDSCVQLTIDGLSETQTPSADVTTDETTPSTYGVVRAELPDAVGVDPDALVQRDVHKAIRDGNLPYLRVALFQLTAEHVAKAIDEGRHEVLTMMGKTSQPWPDTRETSTAIVKAISEGRDVDVHGALALLRVPSNDTIDAILTANHLTSVEQLCGAYNGVTQLKNRAAHVGITGEVVEILSRHGVTSWTAMAFDAADCNNVKTVMTLINHRVVDVDAYDTRAFGKPNLLWVASRAGHAQLVQSLLRANADINRRVFIYPSDIHPHSIIGQAVKSGHTEVVALLLPHAKLTWLQRRKYQALAKRNNNMAMWNLLGGNSGPVKAPLAATSYIYPSTSSEPE